MQSGHLRTPSISSLRVPTVSSAGSVKTAISLDECGEESDSRLDPSQTGGSSKSGDSAPSGDKSGTRSVHAVEDLGLSGGTSSGDVTAEADQSADHPPGDGGVFRDNTEQFDGDSTGDTEKASQEEKMMPAFVRQLDDQHRELVRRNFAPVLIACRFSGCYLPSDFTQDTNKFCYLSRLIFITAVLLLCGYQLLYLMYRTACEVKGKQVADFHATEAAMFVMITWSLQSFVSMIFLVNCLRADKFEEVTKALHVSHQRSAGAVEGGRAMHVITLIAFTVSLLMLLIGGILILQSIGLLKTKFPIQIFDAYTPMFQPLAVAIAVYSLIIGVMCMTIYVDMTICLRREFAYFNRELIKLEGVPHQLMFNHLFQCMMTHMELAIAVRVFNDVFQWYTFMMIVSTVPTTIISLLCLFGMRTPSWLELTMGICSILFCIVELVSLTFVPAALQSEIVEAEVIIYRCRSIWSPFDYKLYELACAFVTHINQDNLGVSMGGIRVVTKTLILTTISLTVTYLTVILQAQTKCVCKPRVLLASVGSALNITGIDANLTELLP